MLELVCLPARAGNAVPLFDIAGYVRTGMFDSVNLV